MHLGEAELKDFLIDSGLLSRSQVASALERAKGKPLAQVLVEGGFLSEDEVRRASAHALGIPFVQLSRDNVSLDALSLVPEPLSRQKGIVAFALTERGLEVALLNLADLEFLEFLQPKYRILPRLTTQQSMTKTLLIYQKHLREQYGGLIEQESRVVEALVFHALHSNASEILLDYSSGGLLVRHRIGGVLREAMRLQAPKGEVVIARVKTAAKIFPVRKTQEGSFRLQKEAEEITVRVYSLPTVAGERISLHILRQHESRKGYTLESLGLHGDALEAVHAALLKRKGLVVVAGAAQSGKTTLLYTMLDTLNAPHVSIATAERVVEHSLTHIAQTQTDTSEGLSMSALVRSVLRQDPDVLMVGDVRDRETAALCARAASHGTFVLINVEATNTSEALDKLRRLGVEPELLASTLTLAVATRTVRTLSGTQFSDSRKLTRAEQDALEEHANAARVLSTLKEEGRIDKGDAWKDIAFPRPVPSTDSPDGYAGSIGTYEVLQPTVALKEKIAQGAEASVLETQARKDGMCTILEDGLYRAALKETSIEEVLGQE